MDVTVQVEPAEGTVPTVEYRWDADTEILVALLGGVSPTGGMSGSVELAGSDGSFLLFDVAGGRIRAVEVAVWPDVQKLPSLSPTANIEDAKIIIPARASQPGIASLAVDTALTAEADAARRTIHFRLGRRRDLRTIRMASDVLLELDQQQRVAGVWFLNVPPSPVTRPTS